MNRASGHGRARPARRWLAVLAALAAALAAGAGERASAARATAWPDADVPRFALFGWVSPPPESTTAGRYAELGAAGMNVALGAQDDPGDPTINRLRLAACRGTALRCLLLDVRFDRAVEGDTATWAVADTIVAPTRDDPALLGWYFGDEPDPSTFDRLAFFFSLVAARDPRHFAWNNLLGRNSFPDRASYLAYTRDYADRVKPAVLANDHYDLLTTGDRGLLVDDVSGLAQVARERGLPFWGTILLVGHGSLRAATPGELRWQAAQWLSYGARGIGYFTYWTPAPDPQWNWQPAMIRYDTGARTAIWDTVAALNPRLLVAGGTLAGLAWLSTEQSGDTPAGGTPFAPDSLLASVGGRAAIGSFADAAGAPYLFVANRDSAASRAIALELVGERRVWRLAPDSSWTPLATEATPRGRRVRLALESGGFALLRVSGVCDGLAEGRCRARLDVAPVPARGAVRFAASGAAGRARLTVLDAGGRRVWSRSLAGGSDIVVWDGTRDRGGAAPAGVYFARLEDATGAVVRRIVWVGAR